MNILKVGSVLSVIFAIVFFLHTILNLIGFAVTNQAITLESIPESLKSSMTFILQNFTSVTRILIVLEAILMAFVLFAFERIAKVKRLTFLRVSASIFAIAVLLPALNILLPLLSLHIALNDKWIFLATGIIGIIFGISLSKIKSSWDMMSRSLGILYILQSIVIFSTFWIPIRLLEFSIAIAIVQAVLFWRIQKI
ncbi:hypothetical protein FJZ18_01840 [Candidatus Pacearchaeota archaeon]|nr:hypothetical protein [Candidatus Pacearchaeota archaeon]